MSLCHADTSLLDFLGRTSLCPAISLCIHRTASLYRGREGQAAINPVEKSSNYVENLRILQGAKMYVIQGEIAIISQLFSKSGIRITLSITDKCNIDLIHGLSIRLFCIPILG